MDRSIVKIVLILLFLSALNGTLFGDSPFDEFTSVLQELVSVSEDYVESIESAQSYTERAKAVRLFSKRLMEWEKSLNAVEKKYPQMSEGPFPEELGLLIEELEMIEKKLVQLSAEVTRKSVGQDITETLRLMQQ